MRKIATNISGGGKGRIGPVSSTCGRRRAVRPDPFLRQQNGPQRLRFLRQVHFAHGTGDDKGK